MRKPSISSAADKKATLTKRFSLFGALQFESDVSTAEGKWQRTACDVAGKIVGM